MHVIWKCTMHTSCQWSRVLSEHAMVTPEGAVPCIQEPVHDGLTEPEEFGVRCHTSCSVWYVFRRVRKIAKSARILLKSDKMFGTLRGGADKSLARPTSPCRRTESIVSLERGVCSCAELQVFSCYRGWKEACQVRHTISTTSRHELS